MWQDTKNIYHLARSIGANIWYGFPSKKMTVIGVTGTDGKTTTASILYHILKEAGYKTALISTVAAIIDGKAYDTGFHVTTADALTLQPYLKKAKKAQVQYVVLETTSIGLHQNRVYGIPFSIGILTNITNEHLDYHKTYKRYVAAKAKLFKISKTAIINKEDKSYTHIKPYLEGNHVITYGLQKNTDINPETFPFHTKMLGGFNTYNALAAIAAARELGVKDTIIRRSLLSFMLPEGREEVVYDKDFTVIIDFAHTPGAFANILPEVKKITKNRLIHIFGAAAQRDTYKRPEMGKISSEYTDIIIITAEDPRNEPIEKITEEIAAGIKNSEFQIYVPSPLEGEGQGEGEKVGLKIKAPGLKKNQKYLIKIPDRKQAINFAINLAQKGDIIILTGKGHEKSMNYGNGEEPWSEHKAVKEALKTTSKIQ